MRRRSALGAVEVCLVLFKAPREHSLGFFQLTGVLSLTRPSPSQGSGVTSASVPSWLLSHDEWQAFCRILDVAKYSYSWETILWQPAGIKKYEGLGSH